MKLPARLFFSINILLFFHCSLTVAQPYVDIINVKSQYFGIGDQHTQELTGDIFLPLALKNDNYLLSGISYHRLSFQEQSSAQTTTLTGLSLPIGGIKSWNETWQTTAVLIPKLYSDFEDISGKDFQLSFVGLATKTVNPRFNYKFGIYYSREFFGNLFTPLFGIAWNVTDRLNIFGVAPGYMNLEYRLTEKLYGGLTHKSITTSYRLSGAMNNNYIRDGHQIWGHNQLKLYANYYFKPRIVGYIEAGHTVFRDYNTFLSGTKNERAGTLDQFNNNVILSIGFAYRVRITDTQAN